ncbi:DNA-binding protein [Perilla frutescens var. hirtella]|nr:DNA-binding protein [Perilla frutescens var. hirtella]
MEKQQELEWEAAQSTEINVDLVSASKTQLKFLAAIDRNRWLYERPGLDRAIYRQESNHYVYECVADALIN